MVTSIHSGSGAQSDWDTKQAISFSVTCRSIFVKSSENVSSRFSIDEREHSDVHTFDLLNESIGVERRCCCSEAGADDEAMALESSVIESFMALTCDFSASRSAVIGSLSAG